MQDGLFRAAGGRAVPEEITIPENGRVFSVEYLPGQFDQRADSAVQCVKFLNEEEDPIIRTATTYLITGSLTDEEFAQIKAYCINPVDSRETGMVKPDTLETVYEEPADVKVLVGFAHLPEAELKALYDSLGLAMTFRDFAHIQNYFCGRRAQGSDHDGDPGAGYLLVRPLPPHHLLHGAEERGVLRTAITASPSKRPIRAIWIRERSCSREERTSLSA